MICNKCNLEFPSDSVYLSHKQGDHKTQLEKGQIIEAPPSPTPPPGVPAEAMPTKEFMETVARIESGPEKPATEALKPSQHPSELPESIPLQLTYKYTGECPDHRSPVDTLELDVAGKHFCMAYCSTGKHQIESKEVAKL